MTSHEGILLGQVYRAIRVSDRLITTKYRDLARLRPGRMHILHTDGQHETSKVAGVMRQYLYAVGSHGSLQNLLHERRDLVRGMH